MHEASLHADNAFLTLTYDDEHLSTPSLKYKDFSDFMKRLRSRYPKDKFLHFTCGEYGETNPATGIKDGGKYRPHFHSIIFGFNFPDRVPVRMLGRSDLFKSKILDAVWGHGACKIGSVSFESAAYVARYAMKKINGDLAESVYTVILPDGSMIEREPEMLHMSKRPAIARRWFEKYGSQVYSTDTVIMRGKEMQPPRYYDKLLPDVVRGMVNLQREKDGETRRKDHTDDRNNVRDVVINAGISQFNRD